MNPPAQNPHEPNEPAPPAQLAPASAPKVVPPPASADPAIDPSKLTPEEQMALYEKDLKENDWGHQPC